MEYFVRNIAMIFTSILSVSLAYYMGRKRSKISKEYNIIPRKNDGLKSPINKPQKKSAKIVDEEDYVEAIESIFGYDASVALEAIKKERR